MVYGDMVTLGSGAARALHCNVRAYLRTRAPAGPLFPLTPGNTRNNVTVNPAVNSPKSPCLLLSVQCVPCQENTNYIFKDFFYLLGKSNVRFTDNITIE